MVRQAQETLSPKWISLASQLGLTIMEDYTANQSSMFAYFEMKYPGPENCPDAESQLFDAKISAFSLFGARFSADA